MDPDQPPGQTLVEWRHSRDEWRQFSRWIHQRKGWLAFWCYLIKPQTFKGSSTIVRGPIDIRIESAGRRHVFEQAQLSRVNILDTGSINVMQLIIAGPVQHEAGTQEIFLPVPKGKLREAIQVQEILLAAQKTTG